MFVSFKTHRGEQFIISAASITKIGMGQYNVYIHGDVNYTLEESVTLEEVLQKLNRSKICVNLTQPS